MQETSCRWTDETPTQLCNRADFNPAPQKLEEAPSQRLRPGRVVTSSEALSFTSTSPSDTTIRTQQSPDLIQNCSLIRVKTGLRCLLLESTMQNPLENGSEKILFQHTMHGLSQTVESGG